MPKPSKRKAAEPPPYHHGDLRAALIRSAGELLREGGPEALTLRAVARHAGVSQAAPYRHFADLRALIGAVAEQGFQRLGAAMVAAMQEDGGRKGFKGVALAYVAFAHAHPAEYRIMFGSSLASGGDLPELRETSRGVLTFVQHGIEALQQAKLVGPGNSATLAATTWAMLHGLVMLSLDGQTDGLGLSLDQLVEETTRIIMYGLAGAAPLTYALVEGPGRQP